MAGGGGLVVEVHDSSSSVLITFSTSSRRVACFCVLVVPEVWPAGSGAEVCACQCEPHCQTRITGHDGPCFRRNSCRASGVGKAGRFSKEQIRGPDFQTGLRERV